MEPRTFADPPKGSGRQVERQQRDDRAFQLLVESTSDYAIFMLDTGGHVASWNTGAERIKGYRRDEILGKHFSVFYPPEAIARDWPRTELDRASHEGRIEDEGWRVRKDGTLFWANVVITALRDGQGQLIGFGKVTRDITERRAHLDRIESLTRELQQRVTELAATNRELLQKTSENESFVYSVSHDLRAPLVNLQGFSQELVLTQHSLATLLADPRVPEDVRDRGLRLLSGDLSESVGFIRNAVQHLSNIIDGLLRLSRVGRVEYRLEPVDVNAVVADILASMRTTIAASGATVRVERLPTIEADRNATGQVFANIVGNAIKCLHPDRRGAIRIAATGDRPPVFVIEDNGIGIAEEYRKKIFQVFQHVHAAEGRGEGMGLAIVRRIVERHGGRIWFESTPQAGTRFLFTLAAGPGTAAPAAAEETT